MASLKALRGSEGFTMVETLVAAIAGILLLGGILFVTLVATHGNSTNDNRATALAQLQTTLERMTREIRSQTSVAYVAGAGNTKLALPGSIVLDCATAGACRRTVAGAPVATLVDTITNTDVFTISCRAAAGQANEGDLVAITPGAAAPAACGANPASYVTIKLVAQLPCKGEGDTPLSGTACPSRTLEVDDGVGVRNA